VSAVSAQKLGLAGGVRVDGQRVSKHRVARVEIATGRVCAEWNATSAEPCIVKARRRKKNKAARASRKANR
jgi:hypothetical protein